MSNNFKKNSGMIKILEFSRLIGDILKNNEIVTKFQIYIRLNFEIDVYIVSKDTTKDEEFFINVIDKEISNAKEYSTLDLYKISFRVYAEEDLFDEFVSTIFESTQQIEKGPRYRLNSYFSKNVNKAELKDTPIATFYSYKGGMGRTTTLVSYAVYLALKDKTVFIIDCDLEAPGYLNFFNLSHHSELQSGKINGLVEYLCDTRFSNNNKSVDINDYVINIVYGNEIQDSNYDKLQNIYLMPAGNLNESFSDVTTHRSEYLEGLSRLNLSNENVLQEDLRNLINNINNTYSPDVILIDSRTGFNDIIGTSINYLSNNIIGFFGNSAQNVPGLLMTLDDYLTKGQSLTLVNSILPKTEDGDNTFSKFNLTVNEFVTANNNGDIKNMPYCFPLHRNELLESLGIDSIFDKKLIEMIANEDNEDFKNLFEHVDEILGFSTITDSNMFVKNDSLVKVENEKENFKKFSTLKLRNTVLQHLKVTLDNVHMFAESTRISNNTFFYRKCMNQLFDEKKYLILGYKGTGKTYLYKALSEDDKTISQGIRKRTNKERGKKFLELIDDSLKYRYIDVISLENGNKKFEFNQLQMSLIENPEFYFSRLWIIYTWNSILLDSEFAEVKDESKLCNYILPISGMTAVKRFEELIYGDINNFIEIENDIAKINKLLQKKNEKLFILYDQLDTRIAPKYWDIAVSPLINYWREHWNDNSNIHPKIFIRTDLFARIGGTNTARLDDNKLDINWSIDEIFGYLFKLVFSNKKSKDCFFEIMSRYYRYRKDDDGKIAFIENDKKILEDNDNQLENLNVSSLTPYITIFFGSNVSTNKVSLGKPYDYFRNTLCNADKNTISLRPFINTLDKNAIQDALMKQIPDRYVKNIIDPSIYASQTVRDKAANTYFDDLTQDEFSRDLIKVRTFINSDEGKDFRYKTLTEKEFDTLIRAIMEKYSKDDFKSVETADDLKMMLFANGIVAEKYISGGKIFPFAPIYYYAWGLKSTRYDKAYVNKYKISEDLD